MTSKSDAARELLRRRMARKSLLGFIRFINPDYIISDFSITTCAALEKFVDDCMAGLRPVLILQAPPQHGKSDIVSRYLPAFVFGHYPGLRIAGLSYAKDLASDMNRDVQRIMMSPEYKILFPESSLNAKRVVSVEVEAKRNSETFEIVGHNGSYVGQGVGGPLTGKRVDCFVSGTKVETDHGLTCIEDLCVDTNTRRILSHNGRGFEYARLKAFAVSTGYGIYRVTTAAGRVFESTGDHRILTGRGYVQASQLSSSDVLLCCLRQGSNQDSSRNNEVHPHGSEGNVLLESLRVLANERSESEALQVLRKAISDERQDVLQQGMPICFSGVQASARSEDLRDVHDSIHREVQKREISDLLRAVVLGSGARQADDGRGESSLSGRSKSIETAAALRKVLSQHQANDLGPGREPVRSMREFQDSYRGPSYRRMVEQQCVVKLDHSVREVPQRDPQSDGLREGSDQVLMVERVREEATVYDIQVEGNANFFANGVLVHNCGIIDDPIKNSKEALSQVTKESIWKWYGSTFLTRLSKNSGHIIMATRWATDDLSGRVLAANPKASLLSFPAINEQGEALIPDLHPAEKLLETKAILGDYFWSAMYQQSPKTIGGAIFKDTGVRHYLTKDLPAKFDKVIQSWDMTFKDSEGTDFVVGQVWGKLGANCYLLYEHRERMSFTKSKAAVVAMTARFPMARRKLIEDKANGPAIMDSLKAEISGMIPVEPDGSKIARAHAITAEWEAGNVWLPHPDIAPWIVEWIDEVTTFPAAANDDRVDAMTQALRDLYSASKGLWG